MGWDEKTWLGGEISGVCLTHNSKSMLGNVIFRLHMKLRAHNFRVTQIFHTIEIHIFYQYRKRKGFINQSIIQDFKFLDVNL